MNSRDSRRGASRRDFAKLLGLGVAASAVASPQAGPPETNDADVEALVRIATNGNAARLGAPELAELRRAIQEDRKAVAKVREVQVDPALEPAIVFRPK